MFSPQQDEEQTNNARTLSRVLFCAFLVHFFSSVFDASVSISFDFFCTFHLLERFVWTAGNGTKKKRERKEYLSLSLSRLCAFSFSSHHLGMCNPDATTTMPPSSSTASSVRRRRSSNEKKKSTTSNLDEKNVFTAGDVAKHNRSTDCWVIVHDRVYDVTKFVPKHPGGNMIHVNAGGECTALFESYHPLKARAVLEKFYIGDVVVAEEEEEEKKRSGSEGDARRRRRRCE